MHPVLFGSVSSYGVMFALAYLTAFFLMRAVAPRMNVPSPAAGDLALWGLVAGLVGARLFYAAINFDAFLQDPAQLFRLWNGGLVFYGGLAGAALAVVAWGRVHGVPWRTALDLSAIGITVGQALGRIGCLLAGCCHGDVCDLPWSVTMHSDLADLRGVPVHPVQAYEAAALAVIGALLLRKARRGSRPGEISVAYLFSYALTRFFMEFFRGDSARGFWGSLSTSQVVSLAILAALAMGWVILRARRPA
ncbi:MAG: prolipoprotein diacylglyceryl transferase [Bdellovibrionales bacterium]|nr:prolipoprotein diacylglyceryl transferase [Bdellovibrionales bacterium]